LGGAAAGQMIAAFFTRRAADVARRRDHERWLRERQSYASFKSAYNNCMAAVTAAEARVRAKGDRRQPWREVGIFAEAQAHLSLLAPEDTMEKARELLRAVGSRASLKEVPEHPGQTRVLGDLFRELSNLQRRDIRQITSKGARSTEGGGDAALMAIYRAMTALAVQGP
jgi:hypothetical protein